ncbi:MAG: multidrug efflux RND transporter permease subunit [Gammaproteobacteria bacterium]|nr:multidrug efflux RND transporter permease subunit [Gammaproteobacteria bacterium]MCP5202183.1 multidrug efflux RND transporter permease subunit [Gammaproteobacteria bacterium]
MRLSHFFVERPIFASVIAIVITLTGAIAYFTLPVAQYPEIVPPTIQVTATYPGASAETVAKTVATPLEQEINGVDDMLFMQSSATGDGRLTINVTFELGTNLDLAQVLVQNRVAIAEPRLPEDVRRLGVNVAKNSPDMLMVLHLYSPDGSRDATYLSNYARTQVVDRLARLKGVGQYSIFSERAYSMRIWIDPERAAARDLTANEIVDAVRKNNVQVASGRLNQLPIPEPSAFEIPIESQGRFIDPEQFGDIVVKRSASGRITRLREVARVELGVQDYSTIGYLDGQTALPIPVFQRPGSNALETARSIENLLAELKADMPAGVDATIAFNPTQFIEQSVHEVYITIFEAMLLVVLVILVFLQSWRAAIIPIVAIPIALIGTFAVMAAFGFSINNLTLFGLVLAVGIAVDDAIVVVENIERYLRQGLSPREAAHKTMDEVGGALVAIALVLSAVFVPTAFISGIAGQFYRQFALTVASATVISALVSLTLSPALGALLLRTHADDHRPGLVVRVLSAPFRGFAAAFNFGFDRFAGGYAWLTHRLLRMALIMLIIYAGLIVLTGVQFRGVPTGFIPQQDQGYLITVYQLPPGASLTRTDAVIRRATELLMDMPEMFHTAGFAGFDGATRTNASNAGAIFAPLKPYNERAEMGISIGQTVADAQQRLNTIREAMAFVVPPPPVRGIGTGGGWKLYVQDRAGRGVAELERVTQQLIAACNADPHLARVFTTFNTATPKIFADIDRVRAEKLQVPTERVLDALEIYLGSAYVNDFNFLGRTYRVTAQAEGSYRDEREDLLKLRTRSDSGAMVPLGSLTTFRDLTGPYRVSRYNLSPAAEVQGVAAPGSSTGEAIAAVERIAAEVLPEGFGFEWTDMALQEKLAGNTAPIAFSLAVAFVFLVLAALYESWTLPLAVILIVPMCLLASITGIGWRGMDNNILVQVGFIVLIGLAAKNAILIVEFARQAEREGLDRVAAAERAARTRLRPILMTSFAFIMGVVPLAIATGAGAEMRRSLGTAVFSGMLGVTLFGLLFTPIFYIVCRALAQFFARRRARTSNGGGLPT